VTRCSPTKARQLIHRERALMVVARAMAENRPLKELEPELGLSYKTILRYRDVLMNRMRESNETTIEEYRQEQLADLAELKEKLESPTIKDDRKVELALSIIDREIRLLGTAAPSKAIVGHVPADIDPEKLVGYRRFVFETRFMDAVTLEKVFEFCRTLNIAPAPRVIHPPATPVEGWDDETPRLTDGGDTCA